MDQSYINSIMNKNISYNFVLILIIIQCVKSQDNDPDQPFEDDENEEDEDNFDVLDLDKIIHERISRFDDPQYQPQYQQLQEYPTQPQTQPQQYHLYQSYDQYHPELSVYQPESSEYYDYYQFETSEYQHEAYGYEPEQYDQYQPEAYGYETPTTQPSQQPEQYYETPITQPSQQPEQYYGPPVTQPSQPSYQYYLPPAPQPQQPQYEYYQPYGPPTPTPIQQSYQYYQPTTAPTTQTPTQPQYQYYQPTTAPQTSHTEITQSPQLQQTQSETVEEDDNFYVTEHDQPIQGPSATEAVPESTQQSIKPQKKPRKRKRTRTTSGDEDEEEEEEEDEEEEEEEEPVKLKKPRSVRKSKKPKFYKRDDVRKLVEMTEEDYVVIFSDKKKTEYMFIVDLEQLEFNNEIIYIHISGTPYCSSLIQSKETDVFVMTNSDGFTLVKKTKGIWTTTDAVIPDFVRMFTKDSLGNEILITSDQYNINLNSKKSFTYRFHPGIKCTKIIVKEITAWKKTDEDDESPVFINVSSELNVMVKFNKYTKMFERRTKYYKVKDIRLNLKRPK